MSKLIIVESPYAGRGADQAECAYDIALNARYAQRALFDALAHGYAPFASHLLYTQVLDDTVATEREWGINAGLALAERADETWVYVDRGISQGMTYGIKHAQECGRVIQYRTFKSASPEHRSLSVPCEKPDNPHREEVLAILDTIKFREEE